MGKDSNTGGGQQQPQPTSSTVTQTNLPEYVQPYFTQLLNSGQSTTAQPYQQYNQPRVAGLSSLQQGAVNQAGAMAGNVPKAFSQGQQLLGSAYNQASQAGQFELPQITSQNFDSNAAQQYMNPYQQNVTDITTNEMNRQFGIQGLARKTAQNQAGAFGGYRADLQDSEAQRNQNSVLGNTVGQLNYQGYQNAEQQFNADQAARQAAQSGNAGNMLQQGALGLQGATAAGAMANQLAQLGIQQRGFQQQDLGNMQTLGALQQSTAQDALNAAYADFQSRVNYPKQQLNWMSGILHGVPVQPSQDSTTYQPPPNLYSQLAGLGLGAAGISKLAT